MYLGGEGEGEEESEREERGGRGRGNYKEDIVRAHLLSSCSKLYIGKDFWDY